MRSEFAAARYQECVPADARILAAGLDSLRIQGTCGFLPRRRGESATGGRPDWSRRRSAKRAFRGLMPPGTAILYRIGHLQDREHR